MSTLSRADLAKLDTLAGRVEEFASAHRRPRITRAAGLLRQEHDTLAPASPSARDISTEEAEEVTALWDAVHAYRYHPASQRQEHRERALRRFAELADAGVSLADIARAMPASRQRASELVAEARELPAPGVSTDG